MLEVSKLEGSAPPANELFADWEGFGRLSEAGTKKWKRARTNVVRRVCRLGGGGRGGFTDFMQSRPSRPKKEANDVSKNL